MRKKRPAKVKKIEISEVELPFKKAFRHAQCLRRSSDSIFIKLYLDSGVVGYGEALPRPYVTGETLKSVSRKLNEILPKRLLGVSFSNFKKGAKFISRFRGLEGAARCAVELALLDALGKHFGKSIAEVMGKPVKNSTFSSGVISIGSTASLIKSLLEVKAFGFRSVKLKVGAKNDLARLKIARKMLGKNFDIRIDANYAWDTKEAIEKINRMREFGVRAIEQPVEPGDLEGLKKVSCSVPETIIADESLVTLKDAGTLTRGRRPACSMFNIRLSKCGGIVNALKIVDIARRNSVRYQLGCQVGESGVLSAAGRHFACGVRDVEYYEGSYGKFLLKEDITKEDMTIGFGGKAKQPSGPGLGVTVLDKVLDKYTVNRLFIG